VHCVSFVGESLETLAMSDGFPAGLITQVDRDGHSNYQPPAGDDLAANESCIQLTGACLLLQVHTIDLLLLSTSSRIGLIFCMGFTAL